MSYSVLKFLDIRYADPICNIDMTDNALIYGTMLGRSGYYSIVDKKFFLLTESEKERISGVQFHGKQKIDFYISIGDDEILDFTFREDSSIPTANRLKNYASDSEHNAKCDGCFTMLTKIFLLRIYMHLPPDPKDIDAKSFVNQLQPTDFIVKNCSEKEDNTDSGNFPMSSFAVPFDYDGRRLLWVDFITETERHIFIFNLEKKELEFDMQLDPTFGHISHMYFLPDNKLFLVKNYNICEIVQIKDKNKIETLFSFGHIGEEAIATNYFIDTEKNITYIITLDIDGNVNLYDDKSNSINFLFNMDNLDGISQEERDRKFFSMDYPYFIKLTKKYILVTTDYGCYLINSNLP